MQIKILGTKGEIKPSVPYHSKHSGVLIDGKVLFDLGEKEFLRYRPEAIFVTHLHPDHAFFVVQAADIGPPVYAPERADIPVRLVNYPHIIRTGPFDILPIPTYHSKKVDSCAYLLSDGRRKILYTGDMIWINKQYHHHLEGLNLVITDGSYIRKGGMVRKDKATGQIYGHTGIPNLVELFGHFTDFIVFVHFGTWFFRNIEEARQKIHELAKLNGITVDVGYDGLTLNLN